MANSRQYDIVLLGATGYTGMIQAEYFHQKLPSNYKWAIAGRSESKLKNILTTLKSLNSTRALPDVLTVNLTAPELTTLAKKTRLILNTIGPYYLYCTPVVQACAENGTHYIDVTGETPWVREIINKFEATAKKSGAIIIPECGLESVPSDILAYVGTKLVRDVWDCGVMDFVACIHQLKSSGPSGGTLATGLGIADHYGYSTIRECFSNPFCLSPLQSRDHRHTKYPVPISYERTTLQQLTGVWEYPFLGLLTTSITAKPNVAIVQRSAGINATFYSYNFTYEEYMRVSNALIGYLIHFVLIFVSTMLMIPPVRWIVKSLVTKAGSGPARNASPNGALELRGIAVAEQLNKKSRRSLTSFRIEGGGAYDWTAILAGEGALSLLESLDDLQKKYGAGFLTPSCLGDVFVKRLESAGVKITTKQIGDGGSK